MTDENNKSYVGGIAATIMGIAFGGFIGHEGGKTREAQSQLRAIVGQDFDLETKSPAIIEAQLETKFAKMTAADQQQFTEQLETLDGSTLSGIAKDHTSLLLKSIKYIKARSHAETVSTEKGSGKSL